MRMLLRSRRMNTVNWLALLCFGVSTSVLACQVPVFRYALERWNADQYQVVVLSDGPLTEAQESALAELRRANGVEGPTSRLLEVRTVNVATSQEKWIQQIWANRSNQSKPVMAVLYPPNSMVPDDQPAHIAPLDAESVKHLLTSPVREEVTKRLIDGESAVWIFVPSGNDEKDKAALEALSNQIQQDTEWLDLPSPEELEVPAEVLANARIKLRIGFSVVTLKRDDPAEKFVLDALLNSESDLRSFEEPMAFPVFGRGRVLYALVGRGIAPDTIRSASSFIVGPCSCQVKNQNPGFDLLMTCDWDAALGETLISEPIPSANLQPTLLTIPPGRSQTP